MSNDKALNIAEASAAVAGQTGGHTQAVHPLTTVLINIFDPLCNALDERPEDLVYNNNADTNKQPSEADTGIRVVLGGMISYLHRQNFGPITTSKGVVPSNSERLKDSEFKVMEALETSKNGGEDLSYRQQMQQIQAFYWQGVNEARFNAVNEMLNGMKEAYEVITGDKWVPMETQASAPKNAEKTQAYIAKKAEELREKFQKTA